MHLTRHTDYALRLLMLLALRPDRRVTIAEIARRFGISRNHLMKVAQRLGAQGYLDTVRGKGGGLTLAQAPGSIRLGRVVRDGESGFPLAECFQAGSHCPIESGCRLKPVLGDALSAFLRVLDGYTLRDLVEDRTQLGRLLGLRLGR